MVTLADIAARTGVSINTVSLVLRNRPLQIPVRQSTIDRIKSTAKELDYRPNRAARTLRLKKSNLIGLVVREFRHPLFARINQELIVELERRGFEVLVTDVPDFGEAKHIEDLYNHQVEGLIVGPFYNGPMHPLLKRLASQRFPLVAFISDGDHPMDCVTVDKAGAAAMAARHLIGEGHRQIGCVVSMNPQHPMTEGYKEAMKEARLAVRPEWMIGLLASPENGYELGKKITVGGSHPTAYYFHDDSAALGFMRALHERKVEVPRRVAVVGYGDSPPAAYNLISLSSVRLPITKLVEGIIERLLARLESRSVSGWQKLVLDGELIVRESSQGSRKEQ